ncbi:p21-activated protein kinase-interacting protein 1-like protein [Mactra antiquata]
MDVILGTYDEVLLGFRVVEIGKGLQIEASFTDNSHTGSIRCVSISKNGILASGSTDETIRLFNLKKQKELGSLIHHDGSVTSLDFHKNFLFSTSEDKTLCIWKTFTWECLRTLKGHKAAINYVNIHPSGKLALTVGRDKALHTWNLITGRSAFITNLHKIADIVKWSPDGESYVIVVQNKIDIYSVETAEVTQTIEAEGRINCFEFLNNTICSYGGEGGNVVFYDLSTSKQLHVCETGTVRIKGLCISCCKLRNHDTHPILTIASSEGIVKLYTLKVNKDEINTELLVEHNTGFRVTCLAVYCSKVDLSNKQTSEQENAEQKVDIEIEPVVKDSINVSDNDEESFNDNNDDNDDDNISNDNNDDDDDDNSNDNNNDDDDDEIKNVSKEKSVVISTDTESKGKKRKKRNRKRRSDQSLDTSKNDKTSTVERDIKKETDGVSPSKKRKRKKRSGTKN